MPRANVSGWLLTGLLALALLPGCETLPTCPESPDERLECPEVPACSRNRVFVFLVAGIDPLFEMEHLRERLIDHGFIKVYGGHRACGKHFADEIQRLHQLDEQARFVIVSQGSAHGVARTVAETAGTPIDLVVLLDKTGVGPVHAERALFIHGEKDFAQDEQIAELAICLPMVGMAGTAKHPETAKVIAKELCAVASKIPVVEQGPRCDIPDCPPCGEGWGFLRPDGTASGCIHCKPLLLAGEQVPEGAQPSSPVKSIDQKGVDIPKRLPQPPAPGGLTLPPPPTRDVRPPQPELPPPS